MPPRSRRFFGVREEVDTGHEDRAAGLDHPARAVHGPAGRRRLVQVHVELEGDRDRGPTVSTARYPARMSAQAAKMDVRRCDVPGACISGKTSAEPVMPPSLPSPV